MNRNKRRIYSNFYKHFKNHFVSIDDSKLLSELKSQFRKAEDKTAQNKRKCTTLLSYYPQDNRGE